MLVHKLKYIQIKCHLVISYINDIFWVTEEMNVIPLAEMTMFLLVTNDTTVHLSIVDDSFKNKKKRNIIATGQKYTQHKIINKSVSASEL